MLHLLRTEWLKLKNYPGFWWIMGVILFSYPGVNGILYMMYKSQMSQEDMAAKMLKMLIGNPFELPEIFRTNAFASSLFMFIPALLVIMLVTNEYTYKTNRQNVIDGWGRNEFLLAKFLNVVIVSVIVLFIYVGITVGIGLAITPIGSANKWQLIEYIGYFGLQVFAQLSFAFMLGILVKRAFIALGIFIFYKIIFENIVVLVLTKYTNDLGRFLPTEVSDRLTPFPEFMGKFNEKSYQHSLDIINQHVILTLAYLIVFWLIIFWVYKKRDL